MSFAYESIRYWMLPGARPTMVRIPDVGGEPPMAPEECQIRLPETKLVWSPFTGDETRAEAQERIRRHLEQIVEDELERIRSTAIERGGVRVPKKRDTQPFEWAVRFQVNEEAVAKFARSQPEQHTVHAGIDSVLRLVGLDKRPRLAHERIGGRPRKPESDRQKPHQK
jgi:hypothetical protein